jgi:acetyl-CoA carboxylase biotin carboxyl carrier protein
MMDFKSIQEILRFVSKSELTEVEIEQKDFKLKVKRQLPDVQMVQAQYAAPALMPAPVMTMPAPQFAAPASGAAPANSSSDSSSASSDSGKPTFEYRSPIIGTFYRSSGPDKDVFVKVGDTVRKGQVLCIIEAMKLFNEIESDVEGKIVKILVENAQPVEYDQPLFLIELS